MTVLGIDDTDSRSLGMCTTYVGHLVVSELENQGYYTETPQLIRLNPAAKHKTRGNAAVAVHTEAPLEEAMGVATEIAFESAADEDEMTNPAVVGTTGEISESIQEFTIDTIRTLQSIEDAENLIESEGFSSEYLGNGRGRIGALAAIGAEDTLSYWTYECITYRHEDARGTEREVDRDIIFEIADEYYPKIWDTVDKVQGDAVCVPNTPGPILYGIRGDESTATVNASIDLHPHSEKVGSMQQFKTNQGTDVHLQYSSSTDDLEDNSAFKVPGTVTEEPSTKEGGHVFFNIKTDGASSEIDVVAFEPTKHFRDKVRDLKEGDEILACGEVSEGTLKLEKMQIRSLVEVEYVNPTCPGCFTKMSSAGADAGYRCKTCSTSMGSKVPEPIDRELELGWYEVPPCARRHIAKPLVRGMLGNKTHPFR